MQPDVLEFWIDINLPPFLAEWIINEFKYKVKTFRELGFEKTNDHQVFKKAANNLLVVVITTKDYDFVEMIKLPGN